MKKGFLLFLCLLLLCGCAQTPEIPAEEPSVRHFILGTDWGGDCDDAVAIRILARAVKRGEISLDGIVINHTFDCSVASLDGFLQEEGIGTVPIGIDKKNDAFVFGGDAKYQPRLVASAKRYHKNTDAEDGVRLYRRILAEADGKVEIIELGFLQVLGDLLISKPDDISPLSGRELVEEKVAHIWCMGGRWDVPDGREYNLSKQPLTAMGAYRMVEIAKCPITFLGWEIGQDVLCGASLQDGDVLRQVLDDYEVKLRPAWDPLLANLAVIGDVEKAGYSVRVGKALVDPKTGLSNFKDSPDGHHFVVVRAKEDTDFYAKQIDDLIG